MMRNFRPNLSDHGPIKSANIMGGTPFTNIVTNCMVAIVCNKNNQDDIKTHNSAIFYFLKNFYYLLNIFLLFFVVSTVKVITKSIIVR